MSDTRIVVSARAFKCEPWLLENGNPDRMRPVPGTWTLAPANLRERGVHGVLCCPNCNQCALIRADMGKLENGTCTLKGFSCAKCGFLCDARLQDWDKRKLFCVAYETSEIRDGKLIVHPHKEHLHAVSEAEARFFFEQSHLNIRYNIVGVAVVLGFFQRSEKDDTVLYADGPPPAPAA